MKRVICSLYIVSVALVLVGRVSEAVADDRPNIVFFFIKLLLERNKKLIVKVIQTGDSTVF